MKYMNGNNIPQCLSTDKTTPSSHPVHRYLHSLIPRPVDRIKKNHRSWAAEEEDGRPGRVALEFFVKWVRLPNSWQTAIYILCLFLMGVRQCNLFRSDDGLNAGPIPGRDFSGRSSRNLIKGEFVGDFLQILGSEFVRFAFDWKAKKNFNAKVCKLQHNSQSEEAD